MRNQYLSITIAVGSTEAMLSVLPALCHSAYLRADLQPSSYQASELSQGNSVQATTVPINDHHCLPYLNLVYIKEFCMM